MSSDRRAYRLARDEGPATGLARVAAGRAEAARERLRADIAGEADSTTAVHDARKDMKKLRTALRLLRDALGKRVYRRENARFRDAARLLSAARDAEVKPATLDALAERTDGLPLEAVEAWRKILDRDREAAVNIGAGSALAQAVELIEAGLEGIASWDLGGDSWKTIDRGLTRSYRRGRRAMKATAKGGGEAELHEWRKRAKDLWYELRLLEDAWPRPLAATAAEAHELSDCLGDHHDLAVLREDLHRRGLGEEETRALEAAIVDRQAELAADSLRLGRRLYAERPRDFDRRLRRYWEAWRG